MARRRRYLFFTLLAALLLFLGAVFLQPLIAYVVVPVALVVWLLLRIFVLSIGQQVYWWALIFLVGFIAFLRFLWGSETRQTGEPSQANTTVERVSHWQASIHSNLHESRESDTLRRELAWLLTSTYAAGHQGAANFQIREALERREIALPEKAYAFLFAVEPAAPRLSFFKHPVAASRPVLRSAARAPARWQRRWTGRATAEYYQAIDEVLAQMETSLEIDHDHRPGATRDDH